MRNAYFILSDFAYWIYSDISRIEPWSAYLSLSDDRVHKEQFLCDLDKSRGKAGQGQVYDLNKALVLYH